MLIKFTIIFHEFVKFPKAGTHLTENVHVHIYNTCNNSCMHVNVCARTTTCTSPVALLNKLLWESTGRFMYVDQFETGFLFDVFHKTTRENSKPLVSKLDKGFYFWMIAFSGLPFFFVGPYLFFLKCNGCKSGFGKRSPTHRICV